MIFKPDITESQMKLLLLIALVSLGVMVRLLMPGFYTHVWQFAYTGDIEGTVSYLRSFGMRAAVLSAGITVFVTMTGILPSIFISAANGIVFGLVGGILLSWVSETIGVIISFWLMRTFLRRQAQILIHKSRMLTKLEQYGTFRAMLAARIVPYSPNGLVTALGAVSQLTYKDYMLACLVGKFPSVALEVVVGHDVLSGEEHVMRLLVSVLVIVSVYVFLGQRRKKQCAINEVEE